MQEVMLIPASEWHSFKASHEALRQEVQHLKRGLATWLGTDAATALTGLSRNKLDARRDKNGGSWQYGTDWKQEGKYILYSRATLEAWNDSHKPRKRIINA